ncbi:MAG: PbsX family transcriptional regulator [Burkholderiaceae bacterium]|nr:PbsX family transcriptional regulator [Burkholderiaceae bacterium]
MSSQTPSSDQTIQQWGNGLAVRLTAPVARAAHLAQGMSVRVEVVEEGILLRVTGEPRLTLTQKLKAFDPERHGGEIGSGSDRVGAEVF